MQPDESASSETGVFAELYEQNLPKVFRYISYRVDDMQLTEDLTSAVFEKALTKFSKYRSDRASFSTWLISIARNTVIDHYRTGVRRHTVPLEEAAEMVTNDVSPDDEVVRNEERQRLQVCLVRLSQEEQEIISLKFGAESTNREIAKVLGLSESNIGVKLYRAICKLRNCFKEVQHE